MHHVRPLCAPHRMLWCVGCLRWLVPRRLRADVCWDSVAAQSWAIDRQSFKRVMMGTTTKKRDKYSDFLAGVELLSTLTAAERLTIADALAPVEFKAGANVIEEGDSVRTDRFYIVESVSARWWWYVCTVHSANMQRYTGRVEGYEGGS